MNKNQADLNILSLCVHYSNVHNEDVDGTKTSDNKEINRRK